MLLLRGLRVSLSDDALRWIHSDEGAPDPGWCPAHGALRRAAWEFWQGTRQHKEVLGETDDAAKATDVVRYLPRADVALPMPIWAITALRSKKKCYKLPK
jgi:hypothetical protein